MGTYVVVYKDGAPSETFTNCSPLTYPGNGTWVRFHGTRNGVTKTYSIPMRRVQEIH